MADGGAILAQLLGNNPLDAYAKGAQISASLAALNQQIAAQTFQSNLQAVELAQKQSQNQFQNQATGAEINIHSLNADTQARFANQSLNPNSLDNKLKQARIDEILGKANGGDAPPPPGPYNPLTSPPSSPAGAIRGLVTNGNPATNLDPLLPNRAPPGTPGAAPNSEFTGANQNPIAAAPPAGAKLDTMGAADTQQATLDGLKLAQEHQGLYGQSWEDSLNPDNDPTKAELASAQAVKQYSETLAGNNPSPQTQTGDQATMLAEALRQQQTNPLTQPPGAAPLGPAQPSTPASPSGPQGAAKIPVPANGFVPPGSDVKPTEGWISRGNRTGYTITRDSDGTLVKTEGTWDPKLKNAATGKFGDFKPVGKSEPIKIVQTADNWQPQSDTTTIDGTKYRLDGFSQTKNGVKTAQWKAEKGEGTAVGNPVLEAGTDHVIGYMVKSDDPHQAPHFVQLAPPKPLKVPTDAELKHLDTLYKQSNVKLNPDDPQAKVDVFNTEHPKANKTLKTMTSTDWAESYQLVQDHNRAGSKLNESVDSLQKAGYELPYYLTAGLPSSSSGDSTGSKLPPALKQFAPAGK